MPLLDSYVIMLTKDVTIEWVIQKGIAGYRKHKGCIPNVCYYNSTKSIDKSNGIVFIPNKKLRLDYFYFTREYY